MHAQSDRLQESLLELDALYADILPWLAQLYDPESGGFFESIGLKQGKEPKAYGPDIQSTFFAVVILNNSGLIQTMPAEVRKKMIHYFQSRQDPETGYFIDPDYPEMWENQRVLGRALSFSAGALKILGSEPLYPLPGQPRSKVPPKDSAAFTAGTGKSAKAQTQAVKTPVPSVPVKVDNVYYVPSAKDRAQIDTTGIPPHLVSVEAFRLWLDNRPWGYSWTALDNLSSQSKLISGLPPALRDSLVKEAVRYVSEIQEPDTGMIGGGDPQVRISGAFKFVRFCITAQHPVPRADKMQATLLEWFRSEPEIDKVFFIRNACDMVHDLSRQTGRRLTEAEFLEVVTFATEQLKQFRQDDGAFRSFTEGSFVSPNDLYLGSNSIPAQAGDQSEMNGTSNAYQVWKAIYWIAGRERPVVPMDDFWEICAPQGT